MIMRYKWQLNEKPLMDFLIPSGIETYPLAPIVPTELTNTFELLQIYQMIV